MIMLANILLATMLLLFIVVCAVASPPIKQCQNSFGAISYIDANYDCWGVGK